MRLLTAIPTMVVLALSIPWTTAGTEANAAPLQRIAFGSCAHQEKPQPIWTAISAAKPNLFLFLGDNIYGDSEDVAVIRAKYAKQDSIPEFAAFRKTSRVMGIWDDHDFGVNDGGVEFPSKVASQAAFADFFQLPESSPIRQRPGIYDAQVFGPEGQQVQVIFLDCRYFRSPLVKLPKRGPSGPYDLNRDPEATVLGAAQWEWLAEQLKVPVDLRIILSSTQVLPQDHAWECWENFPLERARLLNLLEASRSDGVIFLSGDRHLAEVMSLDLEDPLSPGVPVWEITSSSLSNPGGGRPDEVNRHRISDGNFRDLNFGLLEIDWKNRVVVASIRDLQGRPIFRHRIPMESLSRRAEGQE